MYVYLLISVIFVIQSGLLHFKKKEEKLNIANIFHEYKLLLDSIPNLIDGKIVSKNCRSQLANK